MDYSATSETPLLSIVVTVYNHRNYIEHCLRSIAAQKTTFPIEVLVGEDHSPDGTAEVIRSLIPELPDYFTIFCREENLGCVANGADLYSHAQGKYLVNFEGDDYYVSDHSLQDHVDFLETHPEYSATYAKCLVVDVDEQPNGERYPACPYEEYTFKEYFYSRMPGHLSTCVCRREQYFENRDRFMALKKYTFYPGDRRNAFMFLCSGKVRCFPETVSAYRHVTSGGSSYCANVQFDEEYARNEVYFGKAMVDYARPSGNAEAFRVANMTYYRFRLKWCFRQPKIEKINDIMADLAHEKGKFGLITAPLRWYAVLGFRKLTGTPIDL